MDLIPISFHKILQSPTYTVIVLGSDQKKFAIYTESIVGRNLQTYLTEEHKPRPYTHDLLSDIFHGLDIKVLQVVISGVEDTVYYARLFLEQTLGDKKQILEIDARPSDCITLALMHNAPVFCNKSVLEKVIPLQE